MNLPYFILADAHGIETFLEYDAYSKSNFPYLMRANLNRQRHAIIFVARLTKKQAKEITDLISDPKNSKVFVDALKLIKKFVGTDPKKLIFPPDFKEQFEKSYELIPNPKLDPWR